MSNDEKQDIQQLSPDKLMLGFSQTRFTKGLVLAVVFHVLFVGVTSMHFIWRTWIAGAEPEPEPVAEAAAEDAPEDAVDDSSATTGAVEKAESEPAEAPQTGHDAMMEKYKDTPTVRAITEVADPDEIPDMPDGINLSIEDPDSSF